MSSPTSSRSPTGPRILRPRPLGREQIWRCRCRPPEGALESLRSVLVVGSEADEPRLARDEKAKPSRPCLELGPEQAVQHVRLGRDELLRDSVGKYVGVAAIEVVGHFSFDLSLGRRLKARRPPRPA